MEKLKIQKLLSIVTIVIGVILMSMKIYADSEPGAIPLLLIAAGVGWYFFTRFSIRSQRT